MNSYLAYNPDVFKGKVILLPCDDPEWSNFTRYFAQNFKKLKIKQLISTSYAIESKNYKEGYQTTLFEEKNPILIRILNQYLLYLTIYLSLYHRMIF